MAAPSAAETGQLDRPLDPVHDLPGNQRNHQIDDRHHAERIEGAKGVLVDLAGRRRQFDQSDRQCHRGVLEDRHELVGERRQDDPKRLWQQDQTIGAAAGKTERGRSLDLPARQRLKSGANLFGYPRRSEEAKADQGRDKTPPGRIHLLDRHADAHRQQFRQDEIPEEHLHQQRNIAEGLDIDSPHPGQDPVRQGAGNADQRADDERNSPGAQRERECPAETADNPVEVSSCSIGCRLEQQGHRRPFSNQEHSPADPTQGGYAARMNHPCGACALSLTVGLVARGLDQ